MYFNVQVIGSGKAVGSHVVESMELEKEMGVQRGWIEKATGIKSRYYVDIRKNESALSLGIEAAEQAIQKSGLSTEDIDCIIGANGSPMQAIPCAASLFQRELGLEDSGIPCFDVDTTCYSFPMAFFVAANMIANNIYKNVLVISSDAPSRTLDITGKEVKSLFGDGAAAFVLSESKDESKVHHFLLRTYSRAADFTCVKGAGTLKPPNDPNTLPEDNVFHMDGWKVFKAAVRYLPIFFNEFFEKNPYNRDDYKFIIPHQTSKKGIDIFERYGFTKEQIGNHLKTHGNCIAASIPMLFHDLIAEGKVKRGDNVLLFGTSAGLSIGALSLTY